MVGHRLLIKPKHVEAQLEDSIKDQEFLKKQGFQIAVTKDTARSIEGGTQVGTVISVGPMCWKSPDLGYGIAGWREWCKEGDMVVYAKYAGKPITDPDAPVGDPPMIVLNDVDVQAVFIEKKVA
jgi:co-chaperonin GroES (HSP10)